MNYKTKLNHVQQLFTKQQYDQLIENSKNPDQDHAPVVKFFNPRGAATWLISELDGPVFSLSVAFGLCDLGMGSPELGYVSLDELVGIGYVERDLHFKGIKPMSEYAADARARGAILV